MQDQYINFLLKHKKLTNQTYCRSHDCYILISFLLGREGKAKRSSLQNMAEDYSPYKIYAHRLRPSDVGKKVKKVIVIVTEINDPDYNHTGEEFLVESIELEHFSCFHCHKECDSLCEKCKRTPFCRNSGC